MKPGYGQGRQYVAELGCLPPVYVSKTRTRLWSIRESLEHGKYSSGQVLSTIPAWQTEKASMIDR